MWQQGAEILQRCQPAGCSEHAMKILVANPNTTASMTETIAAAAARVAAPGTEIVAAASGMGPASIEGYYDEAFAVPGLLAEIAKAEAAGVDGVVLACFDDTGLDAARSLAGIPVVGICEAALRLGSLVAHRISVVTTLPRSIPPLEMLVHRYGMSGRAFVHASGVPVLGLEEESGRDCLRTAIGRAIDRDGSDAVVLGCAGMADLAEELSASFQRPVIDGVAAAVKLVEALVGLKLSTSKVGAYASPLPKPYSGMLSPFAPQEPAHD
jgi:allantoin racemase